MATGWEQYEGVPEPAHAPTLKLSERPAVTNPETGDVTPSFNDATYRQEDEGPNAGLFVVYPTVDSKGRLLSDDEAWDEYKRTNQHYGRWATQVDAEVAILALRTNLQRNPPRDTLEGRGVSQSVPVFGIDAEKYKLEWWDGAGDDNAWDRLYLGDYCMPGLWEVVSGEVARDVDIKKGSSSSGATVSDQGYRPTKVVVKGSMISVEDWVQLQRIIARLSPKRDATAQVPIFSYHPAMRLLGIEDVIVTSINMPKLDKGIMEMTVELLEWLPPTPVTDVHGPEPANEAESKDRQTQASYEADVAAVREQGYEDAGGLQSVGPVLKPSQAVETPFAETSGQRNVLSFDPRVHDRDDDPPPPPPGRNVLSFEP